MSFVLFSPRHGKDVAASEYQDFLTAAGIEPWELEQRMLDSVDATLGDLTGVEGIFVGGSPYTITEPDGGYEQEVITQRLLGLIGHDVPVLYVCFGAHLVAHAHGGTIARLHPEESGPTTVHLTEAAQTDPLCKHLPQTFQAFTGHTENVEVLPENATLLAYGEACPVQIYRIGDRQWATQFHAEMDAPGLHRRMEFYRDYGYFSGEAFSQIVAHTRTIDVSPARSILAAFVQHCRDRVLVRS